MMLKSAALAIAVVFTAGTAAAADIEGVWLSPTRSAHVRIVKCGDALCGKVLTATKPRTNPDFLDVHNKDPELRNRRIIGINLLEGFRGGPTRWTGGRIYNPGDGNTYHATMVLIDDKHLELTGCALLIVCKSQVWTRLE